MAGKVITIDGPAGSGKSSTARKLCDILEFTHFDSGAIYRAIALYFLRKGYTESRQWEEHTAEVPLRVESDDRRTSVLLAGKRVDKEIRTSEVTDLVSPVSNAIPVRKRVNSEASEFTERADLVADGRDMGTVVFPNAQLKIFLDADLEERTNRRLKDFREAGREIPFEQVLKQQKLRDENDRTKPWGALRVAVDAVVIDSTELSLDEVVAKIATLAHERLGLGGGE
ncbi:MAG: (d)CMP kinase [Planctomycetota bacterium]|nr:(d)CMP kinase [Planctomycetota bacterium]